MSEDFSLAAPAQYDFNTEFNNLATQPDYTSSTSSPDDSVYERLDRPRRTQKAPRSRTGCMTCRNRKVKCDERRPRCLNCEKLERRCCYTSQYTVKKPNEHVIPPEHCKLREGCPVWDASLPTTPMWRRSRPPDTLAPFVNLTNDEERELKATSASIGRYFAIFTPRSFAHLPEYRQWQEPRGENQSSFNQRRQYVPRHFARGPHEHEAERRNADPDVVFIERFEPPVNQAPALLQTLSEAEPPDLTHASSDPPQNSYMEHHTSIQRRMYDCGPQRIVHSGHYNPRHNSEPSKLRPNLHVSATSSYYGQYYPTAPATAPLRDESFIGFPTSSVPVRTGLSARSGSLLEEMVGMHNPDQDHSSR